MEEVKKYHDEETPLVSDDGLYEGNDRTAVACCSCGRRKSLIVVLSSIVALFAVATAGLFLVYAPLFAGHKYDFSGYVCSPFEASPSEARARGCEFDNFTMQWYPKERYERRETMELHDRFMAMGWPRSLDKAQQHIIEDLARAPMKIYITSKEHIWHCGYSLLQVHLWFTMGFDPPTTYDHTEHCVNTMLDLIERYPPPDLNEVRYKTRSSLVPAEYQIIKPPYPCEEHGYACTSNDHSYKHS